jgi:N-acetyltransferase
MKSFDLQPAHLGNEVVKLAPLRADDFERLYAIAADPLLWEQHPNPERYQRPAFENYFEGAMASKGAFLVTDAVMGAVVGCSRYYDYDADRSRIIIGYTFIARSHWGTATNRALKKLMLDHAFAHVDQVHFQVGALNIRSQKAMAKLGANVIDEEIVAYYGEAPKRNFLYEIRKVDWQG